MKCHKNFDFHFLSRSIFDAKSHELTESNKIIIEINEAVSLESVKKVEHNRSVARRPVSRVKIFRKWYSRHHRSAIKFKLKFYDLNLFIIYCFLHVREESLRRLYLSLLMCFRDSTRTLYLCNRFIELKLYFVNLNMFLSRFLLAFQFRVQAVQVRKLLFFVVAIVGRSIEICTCIAMQLQLIQQWIFNVIVDYRSMTPSHINWLFS